ncbi:MAG TPA: sugar ABC transporter permease [Ktedonobacteraceae bacterium]|nr:sugar ABC transporter permease [Ktedonobacteraceae bacterium]
MSTTTQTSAVTSSVRAARNAPRRPRVKRGGGLIAWVFASPWIIIFVIFMAAPIIASLILSFTDFGIANIGNPFNLNFIGFRNYVQLGHDPTFIAAVLNTLEFVVIGIPLDVALGLLIAVGLNRGVNAFRAIFRVGYYLPVVTSIVAIAVVWRYLYDPDVGLINNVLHQVGLSGANWLGNPNLAMPSIIVLAIWRNVGGAMIIFLAGLQGIDKTLYEAAHIDGAGSFARFRFVTLPMLQPTMLFVVVTTTIGFLQVFQEPFVMTGGGPLNRTLTVSMYLYQQGFNFFNQGYASSIAYVMFVVIAIVSLIQFRIFRPQM